MLAPQSPESTAHRLEGIPTCNGKERRERRKGGEERERGEEREGTQSFVGRLVSENQGWGR